MSGPFEDLKKLAEQAALPNRKNVEAVVEYIFLLLDDAPVMSDGIAVNTIVSIYMSCIATLLRRRGEAFDRDSLATLMAGLMQKEIDLLEKIAYNERNILSGKGIQ